MKRASVAMHHQQLVPIESVAIGQLRSKMNNNKRLVIVPIVWYSRIVYRGVLVDEEEDVIGNVVDHHYLLQQVCL